MIVCIALNLGKDAFSLKNKGVTYTMMGGIGMIRWEERLKLNMKFEP